MKQYLIILFAILTNLTTAQSETDTIKNTNSIIEDSLKLDTRFLLGIWENADSTKSRIEFFYKHGDFIMTSDSQSSSGNLFGRVDFYQIDSLCVYTKGVIVKWPPDDCYIKRINDYMIQIILLNFGATIPNVFYYQRLRGNR